MLRTESNMASGKVLDKMRQLYAKADAEVKRWSALQVKPGMKRRGCAGGPRLTAAATADTAAAPLPAHALAPPAWHLQEQGLSLLATIANVCERLPALEDAGSYGALAALPGGGLPQRLLAKQLAALDGLIVQLQECLEGMQVRLLWGCLVREIKQQEGQAHLGGMAGSSKRWLASHVLSAGCHTTMPATHMHLTCMPWFCHPPTLAACLSLPLPVAGRGGRPGAAVPAGPALCAAGQGADANCVRGGGGPRALGGAVPRGAGRHLVGVICVSSAWPASSSPSLPSLVALCPPPARLPLLPSICGACSACLPTPAPASALQAHACGGAAAEVRFGG